MNQKTKTGSSFIGVHRCSSVALLLLSATTSIAFADPIDASGNMQMTTTKTLDSFVPVDPVRIAAIELRPEATVSGVDATLRQVCRWSEADEPTFASVGDLVVLHFDEKTGFGTIDIDQLQTALSDAGLPPGALNFSGSLSCTVSRADVKVDEGDALRQWVGTRPKATVPTQAASARTRPTPVTSTAAALSTSLSTPPASSESAAFPPATDTTGTPPAPFTAGAAAVTPVAATAAAPKSAGDLRAMLISDVATHVNLPADKLQIDFAAEDRKLLALTAPVDFSIEPQRYGDLGETAWNVALSAGGQTKKVHIRAYARAWVDQVVVARPLGLKEVVSEADVEVRHVLADKLARDAVVGVPTVVGKQTCRDLQTGTILTNKMIAPLELAKAGQVVTVFMRRGAINVRSVATALQGGSAGQIVKVRNPTTNEVYEVQLTGPQTGIVPGSDPLADAAN